MSKKNQPAQNAIAAGNWLLVIVAGILIVLNAALLLLVVIFAEFFGWWSLALGLAAVSSIGLAIISIRDNNPSWLLLDLILPN